MPQVHDRCRNETRTKSAIATEATTIGEVQPSLPTTIRLVGRLTMIGVLLRLTLVLHLQHYNTTLLRGLKYVVERLLGTLIQRDNYTESWWCKYLSNKVSLSNLLPFIYESQLKL